MKVSDLLKRIRLWWAIRTWRPYCFSERKDGVECVLRRGHRGKHQNGPYTSWGGPR